MVIAVLHIIKQVCKDKGDAPQWLCQEPFLFAIQTLGMAFFYCITLNQKKESKQLPREAAFVFNIAWGLKVLAYQKIAVPLPPELKMLV